MLKSRDHDQADDLESAAPGRHDQELRRRRIATLIGRLIARDWIRSRTVGESPDRDDPKAYA